VAKTTRPVWGDLPKAKLVRRLGRRLGIELSGHETPGLTGETGGVAEVGRDSWVVLEIETRHGHPVERVLRYWPWLDRNRRRMVLVHVIPARARKRDRSRSELTTWLGALMERVLPGRFSYCRIELDTTAEADQLEAARSSITELRQPRRKRSPAAGL
jgi:hypothetical protein